jgi:hypothetical protein
LECRRPSASSTSVDLHSGTESARTPHAPQGNTLPSLSQRLSVCRLERYRTTAPPKPLGEP